MYLRFMCSTFIVAVRRSAQRGAWCSISSCSDASSLCKVLFALLLSDLDLLLFTSSTKLFGLEGVLGFEDGAAMLWNVAISHVG